MKTILLTILFILISVAFTFCQKQDRIWVFDDGVGLNFNNLSAPFAFNTGLKGIGGEDYATISDKDGGLLFHVNGADSVWVGTNNYPYDFSDVYDRNHMMMPNGDGLVGNLSCTQGSLIIPLPNDSIHYYIFKNNINSPVITGMQRGLYYSVVDMTTNGGLGDVVSKNNLLHAAILTEKLSACKHGNGRDWWVLSHESNNNHFIEFLVTPAGINGPYIQNTGTLFQNSGANGVLGPIKFSKDGTRCAMVGIPNIINVFDFDRCTGLLSNQITIPSNNTYVAGSSLYGCELSPNGNIIYISTEDSLYQYDLTAANISSSKINLWSDTVTKFVLGQMLLAPDDKIYIAGLYGGIGTTNNPNIFYNSFNMNLSVINDPNIPGNGCNFSPLSFYLGGKRCMFGLPNMVNYNLGPSGLCNIGINEITPCEKYCLSISPNPVKQFCNVSSDRFMQATLKIYDVTGRELFSGAFTKNAWIDFTRYFDGIYFIQLTNNDGEQVTRKILKIE